jgi:hypothetical protein
MKKLSFRYQTKTCLLLNNINQQYREQGYLGLENFNTDEACDAIMYPSKELTNVYNFDGHPSVFQITNQQQRIQVMSSLQW